ncbi:MAG: hypothetical protein JRN20_13635 [Nitrososphaerota archaeon]|jgi:hypothetical protein|nr:hypothetical protein [Nitrososphaerota archaeon]MDG6921719.1 hypothetical protein [Nitrososphaerota archaeon]
MIDLGILTLLIGSTFLVLSFVSSLDDRLLEKDLTQFLTIEIFLYAARLLIGISFNTIRNARARNYRYKLWALT